MEAKTSTVETTIAPVNQVIIDKELTDSQLIELFFYKKGVEDLAQSQSSEIHFNSGPDHAMIVMENIFKYAKSEINIFAGNFNKRVCGNGKYLASLRKFLIGGGKINVLLNNFDEKDYNPILDLLKQFSTVDKYKNNISVKLTSEKPLLDGSEFHFTTADDKIYRKEYNIESFEANFSFNLPEEAIKLKNIFIGIFNDSQKTHSLELAALPF